jgi:hypothetical protein
MTSTPTLDPVRALARRAVTVHLNTWNTKGHGRATGQSVILGIGEAAAALQLAMTPFEFTQALTDQLKIAGVAPGHTQNGERAAWIDGVIEGVARQLS